MPEPRLARRYAAALFALARDRDLLDPVELEIGAADQIIESVPQLKRILDHPEVPARRKVRVLDRVLAGRISAPVQAFLHLLVERRRQQILPAVLLIYRELANQARGILPVEVTTAVEPSPSQLERISRALEEKTSQRVQLEHRVDPELLAGAMVKIGDRVIDGSARGRLAALKEELAGIR